MTASAHVVAPTAAPSPSTSTSASLSATTTMPLSRSSPSSSPSSSFARRPRQRIDTSDDIIRGAATTAAAASMNLSSSGSSPTSNSPRLTERDTFTTDTSIQPSPEGFRAQDDPQLSLPTSFRLPEPTLSTSPPRTAMSDALSHAKTPGLIRRISRGAANKLSRRRTSTTSDHRDRSCGPMMRRRSDSRGAGLEYARPLLDADIADDEDGALEFDDVIEESGFGVVTTTTTTTTTAAGTCPASPASGLRMPGGSLTAASSGPGSGPGSGSGDGPVIPSILQHGTSLTKVTKKKRKVLKFVLDREAAKVFWDPSKPHKRFYVDDIRDIRKGPEARNYREECQIPVECEARWFTLVVAEPGRSKGRPFKTIHLIAPNSVIFDCWTRTLEAFSQYRIDIMTGLAGQDETAIRALWARGLSRVAASSSSSSTLPSPSSSSPSVASSSSSTTTTTTTTTTTVATATAASSTKAIRPDVGGRIGFDELERLCRSLHLNCAKDDLRRHFADADAAKTGSLEFTGFRDFIVGLKERTDLRGIYNEVATDPETGLDRDDFVAFVRDSQGTAVDRDRAYWDMVFDRATRRARSLVGTSLPDDDVGGGGGEPRRMNLQDFAAFLSSPANSAVARHCATPKLDRPLNEYFISSSHNTYLLGRQVAGESSTEPYIWALQRGCRCVEVDCWDGPDGRPLVNHGRTLTSSVLFADCIAVINKYAFHSSPYPLIISLEVHCGPEQQRAMVDILKATFGEQLLREPLQSHRWTLPSPEDLTYRVLIKVKSGGDDADDVGVGVGVGVGVATVGDLAPSPPHRSASSPSSEALPFERPSLPASPACSGNVTPRRGGSVWDRASARRHLTGAAAAGGGGWPGSATEDSDSKETPIAPARKERSRRKASKITKQLGDLAVYTRGQKYGGFTMPESFSHNHIFSLSERTFENLCKDVEVKEQLEEHNLRCLMRVYPAGYRINSSNFDPNKFWRRGVQMVALNWQTYDLGLQMNDAMFAPGTGWTGYMLKPKELRPSQEASDSTVDVASPHPSPKRERKLVKFSVGVISAQQLPRPRGASPEQTVDPYIELETFSADDRARGVAVGEGGLDASARGGRSGIGSPHRRRTKIVAGNGYNPVFRDRFTVSIETKFPSLVFLRWTVWSSADGRTYSEKNSRLASFTARLDSLQEGYRHLPLYDNKGEQFLSATLFCHLRKEDTVTLSESDVRPGKVENLKYFGRSVFGRTLSAERKGSLDDDPKV